MLQQLHAHEDSSSSDIEPGNEGGIISFGTDENKTIGIISTESATSALGDDNPNISITTAKWQKDDYFKNSAQEYLFIFSCMMSLLLNQAATPQTLTTTIMNILSESFKSEEGNQTWLMASFPLVSGSFILISGRIGDIYGLKKCLIGGYVVLVIWSIISGLTAYSHSDTFFIVSRAFQGLGVAFILPNVIGIVGNIYIPETFRKNIVISMIGACAPLGAAFGSTFAGLIGYEDPSQWPWVFYAFGITSAIKLAISIYSIPNTTQQIFTASPWIGLALC